MSNSELSTQDWTLADLPIGVSARVVALDANRHTSLAGHGIRPGVIVEVENDAPFGGPRIVNLGFARLAIARAVALTIHVRLAPADAADGSR